MRRRIAHILLTAEFTLLLALTLFGIAQTIW